jgi:hypothetical protein
MQWCHLRIWTRHGLTTGKFWKVSSFELSFESFNFFSLQLLEGGSLFEQQRLPVLPPRQAKHVDGASTHF